MQGSQITALLRDDDPEAFDQAVALVYEDLRRLARVVDCRYFAGLTEAETAETVQVSVAMMQRDSSRARRWLEECLA